MRARSTLAGSFFSGGSIQRNALLRGDSAKLAALRSGVNARFIVLWQSRCLLAGQQPALLKREALGSGWREDEAIYLGVRGQQHLFAVALEDELPADGPAEAEFSAHGSLLGMADRDNAALLAYAKGMVEWQQRHRYCGRCGARNTPLEGGFVMACPAAGCGTRSFPRVDPAIIVLVTDGEGDERCLLGRQARWPAGRFSTIAGFVEPGESLEDALRREVAEETGVGITTVGYMGSQPWPFPGAMMIGFHARAGSTSITLHDQELVEADWFSRERLAAGGVALPPENSIAFRLIEAWFDRWDGPPLESLGLSTSFSRSAGSE